MTTTTENLAAVPGRGDACGAMDVRADIALVRQQRRARVHSDAHADRALREPLHDRSGSGKRRRSRRKGDKERVALRIYLDPGTFDAGTPHDAPMLRQGFCVAL